MLENDLEMRKECTLVGLIGLWLLVWGARAVEEPLAEFESGAALAARYCAICHELPDTDTLDRKGWRFALTYMGFYLGKTDYSLLEGEPEDVMLNIRSRELGLRNNGLLPAVPLLDDAQWSRLRAHYLEKAPEEAIPREVGEKAGKGIELFEGHDTQYTLQAPITSLVAIDEESNEILVGDSRIQQFSRLDSNAAIVDSYATGALFVDFELRNDGYYFLSIGDLMASQGQKRTGQLLRLGKSGGEFVSSEILLEELQRPAAMCFADMDGDGLEDFIVAEFGNYTGRLSCYLRNGSMNGFEPERIVIAEQPGCLACAAHDFDGDGRMDIAVLFGQARESLDIFYNRGGLQFERVQIAQRPASFGYTSLNLVDFNGDGLMDIVAVNGDNGDSDPYNTLKRDHGIRLHMNRGDGRFEETYFYPMYGAYQVAVEDFDLDGDMDMAAVAFHPDFEADKPEGFIYLEQVGDLHFEANSFEASAEGRWMTLDAGDLDGDGDKDLVLGAAYLPVGLYINDYEAYKRLRLKGRSLYYLENTAVAMETIGR